MKHNIIVFTCIVISVLFLASCGNKPEDSPAFSYQIEESTIDVSNFPDFPNGYVEDQTLYLAEGDGIYVFVKNEGFDYGTIGMEICKGNAREIQTQFEETGDPEENPRDYAAIQNILGITEIYLGNYEQAYE